MKLRSPTSVSTLPTVERVWVLPQHPPVPELPPGLTHDLAGAPLTGGTVRAVAVGSVTVGLSWSRHDRHPGETKVSSLAVESAAAAVAEAVAAEGPLFPLQSWPQPTQLEPEGKRRHQSTSQ